ncbi:ceramide synthase isoform X2 [Choloepus didactylus]|uniref:ceramide synthase isoform X2 n=1 Tax=Choloepus didactylus TaxID=27675 RepID=UPI0018A0A7DB|nr:ceramide synthase isoform X2 [Choloepus didactylus]
MLTPMVAGGVVFPGLFLLSKNTLQRLPQLRWEEADAVIVSARLVSSVQAIMASTAGYIVSTSCKHIIDDQHWLSSAYTQFAVPYFVYDIYAMFLCHWHKHQVKGHGGDDGGPSAPGSTWAVARGYLHKEFLMVLHHAVMVLVCFPLSVVWRQGKGDFFLGCLLMAEISTPFVCLGKILIQGEGPEEGVPCAICLGLVRGLTRGTGESENMDIPAPLLQPPLHSPVTREGRMPRLTPMALRRRRLHPLPAPFQGRPA